MRERDLKKGFTSTLNWMSKTHSRIFNIKFMADPVRFQYENDARVFRSAVRTKYSLMNNFRCCYCTSRQWPGLFSSRSSTSPVSLFFATLLRIYMVFALEQNSSGFLLPR